MSDTVSSTASSSSLLADPATEHTRATWTTGDFGRIATGYAPGAASFITRLCLAEGERVLDVACGTGNLALPAARGGAAVTGIDIAPNLVAQAVAAAEAEGLPARFEVGDAEALPYADASFDAAVSMLGAMFAARPDRAAAELLRVVRPGGRIAMANCTRSGFIGQMLLTIQEHAPSALGVAPVLQWGDESVVRERLAGAARIDCVRRRLAFDYACSPAETVALFRECYAPAVRAFAVLDRARGEQLERALVELWTDHNRASDGQTRVESECLEVIAVR